LRTNNTTGCIPAAGRAQKSKCSIAALPSGLLDKHQTRPMLHRELARVRLNGFLFVASQSAAIRRVFFSVANLIFPAAARIKTHLSY